MREPITVDDVLGSKMIASPLRMLDCCLFTDYAGAVVVPSPELAARSTCRLRCWAAARDTPTRT